jgi:predicted phage terminase large subunit-like protein
MIEADHVKDFILSNPKKALELVKVAAARKNLLDFTTYTKKNYQVNWHHAVIAKQIDDFMADPDRTRLIISLPPRKGKTELVSIRLISYLFGKNPDYNIINASYADSLARDINGKVQRVMESDEYARLFPMTRLAGTKDANKIIRADGSKYTRTSGHFDIIGHKGSLTSAGVGSGLTGLGADLFIVDDPYKDWQEASSEVVRKRVIDWYSSVALTRLTPNGKMIIIHTRWHEDDLIGHLLAEAEADPEAEQWEVICIPEEFTKENKYIHPQDPRTEEGEVLWESRYNKEWVKKRKKALGTMIYEALYQQNPTSGENAIFKPSWFQYYKTLPTDMDFYIASWDCSFKDLKSSDFVAGTVWGVKGANKYLVYIVHEQMGIVKTISSMVRVNDMFKLRATLVEDKANGTAVIEMLKSKVPAMIAIQATDSKASRAQAAAPQFEAGNIWLPDKYSKDNQVHRKAVLDKLETIVSEFKKFMNGGKHDDIVDSSVQMVHYVGTKSKWSDSILQAEKYKPEKKTEQFNNIVAGIMGWDLDLPDESNIFDDTDDLFKLD